VVGERLPKALADVNGKPFLWWMLEWLYHQGVTDVMLSVGHGKDFIKDFLVAHQYPMSIILIEEDEPLGTGGAIAHATKLCEAKQVIVLNGDTLSDVSLRRLGTYFCDTSSDLVLAATRVPDSSRFGALSFDSHSRRLRAFDKRPEAEGFIMAEHMQSMRIVC
jgi:D-glycero-alpha-D-manno-heptose 1-phosphate guanylyltransferase